MSKYRQTAADLHNLRKPAAPARWERYADPLLAVILGIAIGAASAVWGTL